jgi:hypothetical protein
MGLPNSWPGERAVCILPQSAVECIRLESARVLGWPAAAVAGIVVSVPLPLRLPSTTTWGQL